MALITGISGLRGTVAAGEPSLSAEAIARWCESFAELLKRRGEGRPQIALGRDARLSSPAVAAIARGSLLLAGVDVLDLGATLTPTIQLTTRRSEGIAGAIMVTASHNPLVWNGLKFLDGDGMFVPPEWWAEMRAMPLHPVPLDQSGRLTVADDAPWQHHLSTVLNALPVEEIRARGYRVALDAANGPAARWAELLDALGCGVELLHDAQDGHFEREAEPLPVHLEALRHRVRERACDLGLAADPDGDRLALVDARGLAISEEHTVVLAAMALAREAGQTVVVNAVTTHAVEEAVPQARVVRTRVGERNVVAGALAHSAVLAGEGSGGIIVPHINLARDGMAAAGVILSLMSSEGRPLHELVDGIAPWTSLKGKLTATRGDVTLLRTLVAAWAETVPRLTLTAHSLRLGKGLLLEVEQDLLRLRVETSADSLRAEGPAAPFRPLLERLAASPTLRVGLTDGIKVVGEGAWLSLRPSNTEPIARVMGEIRDVTT